MKTLLLLVLLWSGVHAQDSQEYDDYDTRAKKPASNATVEVEVEVGLDHDDCDTNATTVSDDKGAMKPASNATTEPEKKTGLDYEDYGTDTTNAAAERKKKCNPFRERRSRP